METDVSFYFQTFSGCQMFFANLASLWWKDSDKFFHIFISPQTCPPLRFCRRGHGERKGI